MNRSKKSSGRQTVDWQSRYALLSDQAEDSRLKAYYQAAHIPGSTPVQQVEFLALDLETTGLDAKKDAIVSVGFLPLFYDRILCSGARYWVVQPEQVRPDIQTTIHGITHTHMGISPNFLAVLGPLLQAMTGRVILAHYSRIEREFLGRAVQNLTGDPLDFPVVDTMELESRKHPVSRPNFIQRWMGEKNSPSLRLAHARERYNLPPYRPHHALTDALATAELFLAQMADQFTPDTPVSELWI